jgi:DNA-binding CsgD family transcriptional regulator/transcriptional regulator with XRE-family HTH domain
VSGPTAGRTETFGERLRRYRVAAGLSQEELAERAGLSAHGISDLERGARNRPYSDTVQRLALALQLDQGATADLQAASRPWPPNQSRLRPAGEPVPVVMKAEPAVAAHVGVGLPSEGLLIGREAELTRVLNALEAVNAGQGRIVLLSGEPGIGKTRLGREVLAHAARIGMRILVGRCFEQHTAVPFFPFTEALTIPPVGPPLLPEPRSLERWPELGYVLSGPGAEPYVQGGQDTQLRVFRAVTAFLREVAETSSLVLLLDDLHWVDATSLSLLLYLGRHLEGSHILLLGTYRDAEVDRTGVFEGTLRDLARERLTDEVHLRPLDLEGTAGLIRQRLTSESASDELVALVHARTAGNPFFTEELLKALLDQRGVNRGQAPWAPQAMAGIDVPRSVRAVVAQRVDRLPPETQELLRLASVIGQEVELEILVGVSGQPEPELLDSLDAARSAGLLSEARGSDRNRYAFVHALVYQALYAELPSSVRRRLHRQIGEVLERLQSSRASGAAELARHFLAAGHADRALGYALRAGREASARYAHAEAANWYQNAINLLLARAEHAEAAATQLRLAGELYDLNQLADALVAYESALGTFERLGDRLGQARVHWGIGLVHRGRYDVSAAVPQFDTALQLWPAERENAELASLLLDAARASLFSRDPTAAHSLAARALELVERCNDPSLLARSLILVAATQMLRDPRPWPTVAVLDRAERVARAAGDWRTLSYVYLARADRPELSGDLQKALADRRAAVEVAERSGDTERLAFAYHALAETHMMMGDWEEGRVAARKGLALDPQEALKGTPGRARLTWMSLRPYDALAEMTEYAVDARQRDDVQGLSRSLAALADMALEVDRLTDAEAPARQAAELLRMRGGWGVWPGVVCGPLAETVVRLASPDAEKILTSAEQTVAATEQLVATPQLLRARALLLQRQGRLDAALEALTTSAELARSQRAGIQLGRTLDRLAALARQRGDLVLAEQTESELVRLIGRIGPEVAALTWAQRGADGKSGPPGGKSVQGRSPAAPLGLLTAREREVAVLLARGLTNRQIAEMLVIAEGTAGVHVDHILNKLGFRSRAQVAAWAAEHGLLAATID